MCVCVCVWKEVRAEKGGREACLFADELANEERNSTLRPKAPVFKEPRQAAGPGTILTQIRRVV